MDVELWSHRTGLAKPIGGWWVVGRECSAQIQEGMRHVVWIGPSHMAGFIGICGNAYIFYWKKKTNKKRERKAGETSCGKQFFDIYLTIRNIYSLRRTEVASEGC